MNFLYFIKMNDLNFIKILFNENSIKISYNEILLKYKTKNYIEISEI